MYISRILCKVSGKRWQKDDDWKMINRLSVQNKALNRTKEIYGEILPDEMDK